MNIWEERYNDEKWGLETPASFRYFQMYLEQPFPRSIKALCEQVNSQQKSLGKSQTKLDTFYNYSRKWHWLERAEAYDEYLKDLHFKTKEMEVMAWESEQLKVARERLKLHGETLEEIHNADEDLFPLTKKAYAEESNERSYNQALEAVYKLLYGGVIKSENINRSDVDLKADVKSDVKVTKSIDEVKEENKEYLKDIFKELEEEQNDE